MGVRTVGASLATLTGLLVGCAASEAAADSRVFVVNLEANAPGIRGAALDRSLRQALASVPGQRVVGPQMTAAALVRANGCARLDDVCLARAAERQRADRVVYGRVEVAEDGRVAVRLALFDLYSGETKQTLEGRVDADDVDDPEEVGELFAKLTPLVVRWPEEGAALVRAMPGSRVQLDGRDAGEVPASGELVLRPVRIGRRVLRVVRPSQVEWVAPVVVQSRREITVTVDAGAALGGLADAEPAAPRPEGTIEPPPAWVLAIPGVAEATDDGVFSVGEGTQRVHFHIPIIREHVRRGEIRTTTQSRLGWLPRVSPSGARVTARVHF